MTKDHATVKPIVKRSNKFVARPMKQLRAVLGKELVHTSTLKSCNEALLSKYKESECKCCDYVAIAYGQDHVDKYSSECFGCAYSNVCNECGWFGRNPDCNKCCKDDFNYETHLEWICHHQDRTAKMYRVRSVYQADLTQYFNAKTMKYMGMII